MYVVPYIFLFKGISTLHTLHLTFALMLGILGAQTSYVVCSSANYKLLQEIKKALFRFHEGALKHDKKGSTGIPMHTADITHTSGESGLASIALHILASHFPHPFMKV